MFPVNEDAVPCTAKWFHNNEEVLSSPRFLMVDTNCDFRLQMKNLEFSDEGDWSVQIANVLGSFKDQCKLTLKGIYILAHAHSLTHKGSHRFLKNITNSQTSDKCHYNVC